MRLAWLLGIAGCASETWFELGVDPGPTAVGARLFAGASSGNCREGERASHCSFDTVTTKSVVFDDPSLFARDTASRVAIDLLAVAEGTTRMTVVADNGDEEKTFYRSLTALPANRAVVTPTLRGEPCASPARYAVGHRPVLTPELYAGDTRLGGRYYHPFELTGGATIDEQRSVEADLFLVMPSTPGAVTMTSPIDPSFSLALEAFAPADVEAIVLGEVPAGSWFPLSTTRLPVDVLVDGTPICGDALARTARTTGVCKIYEEDGDGASDTKTVAGMTDVLLRAYSAGECTVEVTLDGTTLSATKTLTVLNR